MNQKSQGAAGTAIAARRQKNNAVFLRRWMWDHIDVKMGEAFLVMADKNKYGKFVSIFIPNEDNIEGKAIINSFNASGPAPDNK
jgi:hypothetical protein